MIIEPNIFIYEDGTVYLTPESLMIPEVKDLVDKYGEKECIPYIAYGHLMTSLRSPYRNYQEEEKKENVIYDVIQTIGDFDIDEPLLEKLLKKLIGLNSTPLTLFFLEIEEEIHRMRNYLKNNSITGGKDGDLTDRFRILKEAGSIVASYNKTKIAAEEELKVKARGKGKVGDY